MRQLHVFSMAGLIFTTLLPYAPAQQRNQRRPPQIASPEVLRDRKIVFRMLAPKASAVTVVGGDIPGAGRGIPMKKIDEGVWQATVGPVPAGAYRYMFFVDGVAVIDPRNPATSESNANTWSLVDVSGSEKFDTRNVPHGAVAEVTYYSKTLSRHRRMHIYTPPGYQKGQGKFPVLYLLHGATDSDASWSTVGRAGFILDNLIADKAAKPMLVVMPAGHTGAFTFGGLGRSFEKQMDEFNQDFVHDVRPYVEKHYRVVADQRHRAVAGLSMGGAQALNIGFGHLDDYGYIGVFSSGIFGIVGGFNGGPPSKQWEEQHQATLDDAALKKGVRLIWFGCGKQDFLLPTSNATIKMLKSHQFKVVSKESAGGHTWLNWRDYLVEFAPILFTDSSGEHE